MKPKKRRKKGPPFVGISRSALRAVEWRKGLSSSAKVLYIHLKHKYVGTNNGEICLHYSEILDFMSSGTIAKAFKELEAKEWIYRDHTIGGKYRFTVYYKLTGKYDKFSI